MLPNQKNSTVGYMVDSGLDVKKGEDRNVQRYMHQ